MKSFTIVTVTSGRTMSPLQKVPTTIPARSVSYQEMGEVSIRRSPPRILVVDDNQDIMGLMQELLATHGYDVVAVPDAIHAEAEILRHPPDLILSDVVMPGKSGYELCRELKENPATRLIPFVLITGLTDRQDRVLGIESGADDFLNKPIFPEELFARVKSLLKLKEFTDELETAESVLCTLGLSVESARSLHRRPLRTPGEPCQRPGTSPPPGSGVHCGAAPRRVSARSGKDRSAG